MNSPILKHFDSSRPVQIRTDASNVGLGAIISHDDDNVIAYASRKLIEAEKNYTTSEKECLCIVWAIHKFRQYLCMPFKILTDHCPLCWLRTKQILPSKLMRWALQLQAYDFEIEYKQGKHHHDVDTLSRYPIGESGVIMSINECANDPDLLEEIKEAQIDDTHYGPIKTWLQDHNDGDLRYVKYGLKEGVLYKKTWSKQDFLICVPERLIRKLLQMHHDDSLSGHLGVKRTYEVMRRRYIFPNMKKVIEEYIKSCD